MTFSSLGAKTKRYDYGDKKQKAGSEDRDRDVVLCKLFFDVDFLEQVFVDDLDRIHTAKEGDYGVGDAEKQIGERREKEGYIHVRRVDKLPTGVKFEIRR